MAAVISLEERCLSVLSEFADYLNPNIFLEIPRHLLTEICKRLNPFDLESLENAHVFEKAGINTEGFWKDRYHHRWLCTTYSKSATDHVKLHVPEEILSEQCDNFNSWKAAYLGRHLVVVLNESDAYKTDKVPQVDNHEVYLSPLLNRNAYQRIWSLEKTLKSCSRYATFLTLSNRACIYLAKNAQVLERFADHVKFLRLKFVQKSSIASVCWLLETLASKNLIGLELCKCREISLQSWSTILRRKPQGSGRELLPRWQQMPGIQSESSHDCSFQDFLVSDGTCTMHMHQKQLQVETVSGSSHFCHTSNHMSLEDRGSPQSTSSSSAGDIESESNQFKDLPWLDFDVDVGLCAGGEVPQSKSSGSPTWMEDEDKDYDLFDEVFACSDVINGSSCEFSVGDTAVSRNLSPCIKESADMIDIQTYTKAHVPAGVANSSTLLSHLRHLQYSCSSSNVDSTGRSSFALLLEMLKHCHRLESVIVVGPSQSCGEAAALGNAILDLCSKDKLRYFELHDICSLSGTFMEVFDQVLGSYCSFCQWNMPGSLKSLRLLGIESFGQEVLPISAEETVRHIAEKLPDVCSCARKGAISSRGDTMDHLHKEYLGVCSERVHIKEGRDELPQDMSGREASKASVSGESIGAWPGNVASHADVHVVPDVEVSTNFTGLQQLELNCWTVGNDGASAIAASLEKNSSLTSIALPCCGIGTPGMSAIFKAIAANRSVRKLNLSGNHYSLLADNSLADMLRTCHAVSELDLSNCLSNEGLTQEFVFSLCQNSILECLRLNENRLGDSGVEMLVGVFREQDTKSRITRLELSANRITSRSVTSLATALQLFKPRRLEELFLAENHFGSNTHIISQCLQSLVDNVYVSSEDSSMACADYVSEM